MDIRDVVDVMWVASAAVRPVIGQDTSWAVIAPA